MLRCCEINPAALRVNDRIRARRDRESADGERKQRETKEEEKNNLSMQQVLFAVDCSRRFWGMRKTRYS